MDRPVDQRRWHQFTSLSSRIPAIQKIVFRRFRSAGTALGWGLSCLALAFFAHRLSSEEAILRWKKSALPSMRVWREAVRARGLMEIQGASQTHAVLRTLPSQADSAGEVWWSGSGEWIVVYHANGQDELGVPALFGRSGSTRSVRENPPRWEPLGQGWDALDTWVRLSEKLPAQSPGVAAKAVRKRFRDPREIIY